MFNFWRKKKVEEVSPKATPGKAGGYAGLEAVARSQAARRPDNTRTSRPASSTPDPSEDFGTSMAVGMATDNAMLGYLMGRSISGGLIGQSIADAARADDTPESPPAPAPSHTRGHSSSSSSDHHTPSYSPPPDHSSSSHSSSSYDHGSSSGHSSSDWSGGSYDSGSSYSSGSDWSGGSSDGGGSW